MGDDEVETNGSSGYWSWARRAGSWWGYSRPAAAIQICYVATVLVIGLTIWGWLDVRERGQTHPNHADFHRTDFTVYTEAGAAFFDGREPYEATNPRGWYYLYPPLFALLVSPLAALDYKSQVVVWYIISGSSVFKCKTSQIGPSGPWPSGGCARSSSRSLATPDSSPGSIGPTAVSYTHLTLPTKA